MLRPFNFHTVLDGFGGTASVSLLFKAMGKQVYFCDALTSNTISARALLKNRFPLETIHEGHQFISKILPMQGMVTQTFTGKYFTDAENNWIDGAVYNIEELDTRAEKDLYLYCLFQSCLMKRPFNLFHRANLNLRTTENIKRSFGNLTTWNHPFDDLMKQHLLAVNDSKWCSCYEPVIYDATDVFNVKPEYDLVYLDPPYVDMSGRCDDYLKRYHFLEGLSDVGNWEQKIDISKKNLPMYEDRRIKDWNDKRRNKDLLFQLIDIHKHSIVALSYISDAHPNQDDLVSYFKSKFRYVQLSSYKLSHALSAGKKIEILVVGAP